MARINWSLLEGYILHQRPYRETSVIAEFFSRDEGRIPLLLNGIRGKNSRRSAGGLIQPFDHLAISVAPRGDMRRAEVKDHLSGSLNVVGARTFFGLYVNELVYRLSARHERTPEIFDLYHQFMEALKLESFQVRFLTGFEVQFLRALGYAIDLGRADGGEQLVETSQRYRFDPELGLMTDPLGALSGAELKSALSDSDLDSSQTLLRSVIDSLISHLLRGRQINARALCEKYR